MVVVVAAGARRFYREFIGQDSIVSLLAGATLLLADSSSSVRATAQAPGFFFFSQQGNWRSILS